MKTQSGNWSNILACQIVLGLLFLIFASSRCLAQTTLTNYLDNTPLDASARKVVILIHGWNPDGFANYYQQSQEWRAVRDNLQQALSGSDWKLVLFHWESDANSGSVWNLAISDFFDWGTATTAAANAYTDGGTLGLQLSRFPNLREVQFIAHSAGAWAAQQAAQMLLIKNPLVVVQITLLDPYIPDSVNTILYPETGLNNAQMSNTQFILGNDRIRRLENYYADDSIPNPLNQLYPTLGTQDTFAWRAQDINQQVDNGPSGIIGINNYYDYHNGPVQFYADTIQAANGQGVAAGLTGLTPSYTQLGWYRSLYSERNLLPQITSQPQSTSAVNGASVTLSVSATGQHTLNYQWFKDGQHISGATSASYAFTLSPSTVSSDYVVEVIDSYSGAKLFSDSASASTNNPSLVITSVVPSVLTGQPLPQKQPIKILGSGFAGGCTLTFNDGVDAPFTGKTPTSVSANELDYNIAVGTNAANWTVQVVNGGQQSSLGYFSVVPPPPPSNGSLVVAIQPAGAVSAGAQWNLNGGVYHTNGEVVTLAPGAYTISCKTISGYTAPSSHSISVVAGVATNDTETYTAIPATTYTLTLNVNSAQGSISASPSATGNVYDSSSVVQLTASPDSGYHFTGWSGAASGTANPTTITMNADETVTANFASGDLNLATIAVNIQPSAARTAGAQWKLNSSGWMNSGDSFNTSLLGGNYNYLQFKAVSGWITPSPFYVNVSGGETTNITVTYQADTTPGLLTVTLSPPDAVNAGAHWHVNGGTYGNGASVSLPPGTYTVSFDSVSGWTAPASQSVTIQASESAASSGNYMPPAGQPAIISISPPIGPKTGGTVMTINGANFATTTNVLIGGKSASNIAVVSATQVTCLIPPSTTNGSVSVIVQTTGGNATSPNGFAYGVARGNKLDFVSATGGNCFGVAVNGNYAYIGEGRNFLVLDTSQSPPSRVGHVTLPGLIRGIALLPPDNQYAYVADEEGGLQVVDVSSPTTPKLAGFYYTTNQLWSAAISIFGGRAYVADEDSGLQIFDLSNPTIPTLLSSTNLGGGEAITVKASVNGVFAYVSTGGRLDIVDVSNPLLAISRGSASINGGLAYSLAILGDYVYAASLVGNLEIIDVSNTNAPADVGHAPGAFGVYSVTAANGLIYAAPWAPFSSSFGFDVFSPNGSGLTLLAQMAGISSTGYNMLVSGTKAYIAGGSSGFEIVDVSNPYNPTPLQSFTDSGVFGQYNSVAITGNSLLASGYGINAIFNVSNPSAPTFAANLNANVNASYTVAKNGLAYALSGNSNFIFNVSTPSSPSLVKLFANTAVPGRWMSLVGSMLYVVGYSSGNQPYLAAIDVSTPSSPVIRGTKTFSEFSNGGASAVAVNGTKALVGISAGNTNEVITLDISNIASPVEKGAITNLPYYPKAIQFSPDGNFGYTVPGVGGNTGLYVLNVSQLSSPTVVTNIPLDVAGGTDLQIQGNELFVSTFRGLYVFDVSNPASPVLTRSYSVLSGIEAIGLPDSVGQAGNIYLATLNGGIVVLREQDIEAPQIYISNPTFGTVWPTTASTLDLGGGSSDNVSVTAITWSNNRGGSGQISPPLDNWYVTSIPLYPGTNILTVTAYDAAGNAGTDALTVVYQTSKQNQTITFPTIADHAFGDAPIQLTAAASSGLPVTFSVVSGSASISNDVLTVTGAGAVTVEAAQSGNDLFNPATPVDVSFNVARADQSIDFAPLPDKSAGDPPFTLNATTSSGLPVYFSILSGPAILNTNSVSLAAAGTVTVVAYQPGNSNYNAAATIQRSFSVSKIPQTITFGALSLQKVGDAPFPLNATASSGLPVNYSISGPATLNGNIVTLTGYGTVTVTASQAGNDIYAAAANVTQSFMVAPPDNTLVSGGFLAHSGFQMDFYGVTGSNYTVQTSSNLLNWEPFTNFVITNSPVHFNDSTATNFNQRFYRAVLP